MSMDRGPRLRRAPRRALPRGLMRVLRGLLIVAVALAVLRAIALPLARQRQERRVESATLVALLPADIEAWCMERPALRRAPAALWPSAEGRLREQALAWGLPLADLEADSLLRLTPFGGEWLCARRADGAWLLIGARDRLRADRVAAGETAPQRLPGGYSLRLAGERFLIAADPALLAGPRWLDAQVPWLERDDLLLGADWLEFRAAGRGGALVGAKWVLGSLLCEGLAWGCTEGDGDRRLAVLCPGPAPEPGSLPGADSLLAATPLLRRSGPFAPDGRRLPLVASGIGEPAGLRSAERRWRGGSEAALARVLSLR